MKGFRLQAAGYGGKTEGWQSRSIAAALWGLGSDYAFDEIEVQQRLEKQHLIDLSKNWLSRASQIYVTCMDSGLDQNAEIFSETFLTV